MCYKEYTRKSTHMIITETKQKEDMTVFVNTYRYKKWLEMEGNMCIASRPELNDLVITYIYHYHSNI